ncbi:hypothetical protein M728_002607 [Ensifer sp. WSM1721]|uniref:hypothetical protein n=1 Tax=Ensifer sp. WSM1721 TaxID=1041159 RepID=UPI00047CF3D7|nr:hypothetical protein [Ensifer sp. WSM1721]
MADFVAVIRRTVDGLSENTPEMRGRVYEKARSAVRRQLENMNPRPSDDMINRQLNKLEQAIAEVESENAEALPAIEETETVEPAAAETQLVEEPASPAPPASEAAPEEVTEEPAAEVPAEAEPSVPAYAEAEHGDEAIEPAPAAEDKVPDYEDHTAVETSEAEAQHEVHDEEPVDAIPATSDREAPTEEPQPSHDAQHEFPAEEATATEGEPERFGDDQAETAPHQPEPTSPEPTSAESPLAAETPAKAEQPSEWALPDWEDVAPAASPSEPQAAPETARDEEASEPERLGMHPVEPETAQPEHRAEADAGRSWFFDDSDPFATGEERKKDKVEEPDVSEWSWPVEKPAAAKNEEERAGSAWDHIDDLLSYSEEGRTNGSAANGKANEAGFEPLTAPAPARPASYRATPKPRRFGIKQLVIGVVIALLLGGGGYAYWLNRDVGNAWIADMIAKVMPAEPAEAPTTPAGEGEPAIQPTEQSATPDDAAPPEGASTKFTQRLLADGNERDEGPAGSNGTAASQEGKSVAAQTQAGQPQTADVGVQQAAADRAPSPETGQGAAQTPQPEVSIADGEKMFLYEERLGQSSPTAIPGSVAWSIKEESPGGDAKPEPAIQAQITVPDRGLTALMTIKRNADPSLPASHVIEFVFSLPENFEGGSIDGVQRVSMKRTEQDRGDPLIAVPAKITDDFHMIALNDFAEAVSNNTELLRSRTWIDIPITYRNGRRALLTLEKGASGTEAFNKALQAWGSQGSAAAASGQ